MRKQFTIEEIDELLDGTTPGPWCTGTNGSSVWTGSEYDRSRQTEQHALLTEAIWSEDDGNCALAAAAPDLAAALKRSLAREDALRKRLDALRNAFTRWTVLSLFDDTDVILEAFSADDAAAKAMVEP